MRGRLYRPTTTAAIFDLLQHIDHYQHARPLRWGLNCCVDEELILCSVLLVDICNNLVDEFDHDDSHDGEHVVDWLVEVVDGSGLRLWWRGFGEGFGGDV